MLRWITAHVLLAHYALLRLALRKLRFLWFVLKRKQAKENDNAEIFLIGKARAERVKELTYVSD